MARADWLARVILQLCGSDQIRWLGHPGDTGMAVRSFGLSATPQNRWEPLRDGRKPLLVHNIGLWPGGRMLKLMFYHKQLLFGPEPRKRLYPDEDKTGP